MVSASLAELSWGSGQGPAAVVPGTSWDVVGLRKGTESREGYSSTDRQVIQPFWLVWACLAEVFWGWGESQNQTVTS